jgi:hypothetical protein
MMNAVAVNVRQELLRTSSDVGHCCCVWVVRGRATVNRKNWGALGCAAFIGAALAFPAGMIFGGREAIRHNDRPEAPSGDALAQANFRKIYSPQIHNDPYVQGQWRKVVEELEAQCRKAGERCTEAKAARRWLSEQR